MSLDTLKSVLSAAGEHLGDMLWWTLSDARIDRKALESIWQSASLKPEFLPEAPTPEKALKTAARECAVGQVERLVRLTKEDEHEVIFAVVRETKHPDGSASYAQEARVTLDRVSEQVNTDQPGHDLAEGRELEALFDRFLFRFEVGYLLRPSNLRAVLTAPDPVPSILLTLQALQKAQAEVAKVAITDDTLDGLIAIRDALKADGIIASDRRWKKSLKIVPAAAFMAGEKQTCPEDLAILIDSLWREPKERPKIARIVGKLADPVGSQATEILDAARETAAKVTALKSADRKQYISQAAQAIEQFNAQQDKLGKLVRSAGRRGREIVLVATALAGTQADGGDPAVRRPRQGARSPDPGGSAQSRGRRVGRRQEGVEDARRPLRHKGGTWERGEVRVTKSPGILEDSGARCGVDGTRTRALRRDRPTL